MSEDVHVRFGEGPQGRVPRSTHLVITGSSKELLEIEVQPLVKQFLQERGLELSTEKTALTHIQNGFEFRGQQIRESKGKILVPPSRPRVHTRLTKVRALMKATAQATTGTLILQLTPHSRGWASLPGTAAVSRPWPQWPPPAVLR